MRALPRTRRRSSRIWSGQPDHGRHRMGGRGGIGRRAGFRFRWETMQVRVLSSAEISRICVILLIYYNIMNFVKSLNFGCILFEMVLYHF